MIELHDRFDDWLVGGGRDDPPRDLALHASGCDSCLRAAAAIDALQGVDIGAAPMPAMRTTAPRRIGPLMSVARTVASAAAALVVGTALVIGASSWLGSGPPADETAGQRSPGDGVLAGGPSTGPSASGSPAATPSPRPSPSPTPSVLATPAPVILPTVAPPIFVPAPTIVPVPLPTATPAPTSSPTVAPTTIPTPTTAPTPPSSASASPSPSPSPTDSSRPSP